MPNSGNAQSESKSMIRFGVYSWKSKQHDHQDVAAKFNDGNTGMLNCKYTEPKYCDRAQNETKLQLS